MDKLQSAGWYLLHVQRVSEDWTTWQVPLLEKTKFRREPLILGSRNIILFWLSEVHLFPGHLLIELY